MLFAGAAVTALYAGLLLAHWWVLDGQPRLVIMACAGVSVVIGATMTGVVRSRTVPDRHLPMALTGLAALVLVNSLTHIAVTGEIRQTTVVMLTMVGVGAVVSQRRLAAGLVGAAVLVWAAVVTLEGLAVSADTLHYAFGMAMAAMLAYVSFGIRSRNEQGLRAARDELDAQLAVITQAWKTVEESNTRFHGVFTASPVGIGLADEHGRFTEVNDALCALLGRPAEQLLGHSSRRFTHPDDLDQHAAAGQLVRASGDGVVRVEKRYLRPDGTVVWAWLTIRHVPGPEGQTWTLAHVQDVTDRKRDELALRHSRQDMAAVAAVAVCGQNGTDPRPVVVQQTRDLANATSVGLVERDGDHLVVTASAGRDVTGTRIPLTATSATVHAWSTGTRVFIPDVRNDPLANPALAELTGTLSTLCEPVLSDGNVIAVLVVGWPHTLDELGPREAEAVAALAAETGAALTAQRLRAQLEQQATTDQLTGLLNRRGWTTQTERLMAMARRRDEPLTLVMADLDHFKKYNDTHGHHAGDMLLTAVARACQDVIRDDDAAGRWGG